MMRNISMTTSIGELVSQNPGIKDVLVELGFDDIDKPQMIQTMGRIMNLKKGCRLKKIPEARLWSVFREHGYQIED